METLQDNPGLANGKKRGSRPDVCTIQVKEPKDATDGQKAYFDRVVKAKRHFENRPFNISGQDAPVVLGHYGCMAVLESAWRAEEAGIDVMGLMAKAIEDKAPKAPKADAKSKPEKKAKAKGKGKS